VKKQTTRHYNYQTPLEFIAACKDRPTIQGACGTTNSSNDAGFFFSQTTSLDHAYRLAEIGDQEMAKAIVPRDANLLAHGASMVRFHDVTGDQVDVSAYLSGDPNCMVSNRKRGKPIINILVNLSPGFQIESRALRARGKAILEIITGLESNGYSVEVTAILVWADDYSISIKIKDSKDYFNIEMLAYWLVSPSVMRRLAFKHIEAEPKAIQKLMGGHYGVVTDLDQAQLNARPDCIYFPRMDNNDTASLEATINKVMKQYEA